MLAVMVTSNICSSSNRFYSQTRKERLCIRGFQKLMNTGVDPCASVRLNPSNALRTRPLLAIIDYRSSLYKANRAAPRLKQNQTITTALNFLSAISKKKAFDTLQPHSRARCLDITCEYHHACLLYNHPCAGFGFACSCRSGRGLQNIR